MSQAEAVKMMRLIEEVELHRGQIAELRHFIVELEKKLAALMPKPKG